jgi:hypothetical protein
MKCEKCGKEFANPGAFGGHSKACKGLEFYSRHEGLYEKCPVCNEIWADFWKRDDLWVCLKCGCAFVPRSRFEEVERIRQAGA